MIHQTENLAKPLRAERCVCVCVCVCVCACVCVVCVCVCVVCVCVLCVCVFVCVCCVCVVCVCCVCVRVYVYVCVATFLCSRVRPRDLHKFAKTAFRFIKLFPQNLQVGDKTRHRSLLRIQLYSLFVTQITTSQKNSSMELAVI